MSFDGYVEIKFDFRDTIFCKIVIKGVLQIIDRLC